MNNPTAFEQDPDAPEGAGTFRFEDGSSLYAMEPELARQVTQLHGPKLAQLDDGAAHDALLRRLQSGGPAQQEQPPDPYRGMPDVPRQPLGLPPEASDDSALPAHMRTAAAFQPPPPAPIGPPLPPGGAPAAPPAAPAPAAPPPRPMVYTPGRNPAAEAAAAVPVPTKATTVVEAEGAPYDPGMAELRERVNQGVVGAKMAEFDAQRARYQAQAEAAQAAQAALRQQALEQQKALEDLKGAAQKERDRLNKYDEQAKVDPGQLYKQAYGLTGLSMIVGQALGAYAAVLGGGDNFAQRAASQMMADNLELQREQIKQGHDNLLAELQREYGDTEQAETAFRILQSQILDREIQETAATYGSQDAMNAANVWLAQNRQARLLEEQKFMDQSMGKRTQTVSADMVVPRRGGSRPMTDAEIEEAQIKANERGARLYKSENDLQYQRGGGEHAKDGKPDPELYVEGFGQAKTKQEAVQLRGAIAAYQAGERDLDRASQLDKSTWSKVGARIPFTDIEIGSEEYTEAGQLQRRGATTTARGYGGPITQSDRDAAALVTPDARRLTGDQDVIIESARRANRERLNEQIRAIISGDHPELPSERKGRE